MASATSVLSANNSFTENFNGVEIKFSPPNLPEQRTFKLRGQLNKKETEILAEAIPTIARFLNFIRLKDKIKYNEGLKEPRKPYEFINTKVSIAPSQTYNWLVTSDTIQFQTDFIVNFYDASITTGLQTRMGDYYFRDAYIFKKINNQWIFYDNFGETPYGFLKCKRVQQECMLDKPLW